MTGDTSHIDEEIEKLLQRRMDRRRALSTGAKIGLGIGALAIIGGGIAATMLAQPSPTTIVQTVTQTVPPTTVVRTEVSTVVKPEVTTITQAGTVTTVTRPVTEVLTQTITEVTTAEAGPRRGGTLRFHITVDPVSLNPLTHGMVFTVTIAGAIFDRLIMRDWELNYQPMLARKWEISEDGKTYTFDLVKNAKWHDGVPFTAEDVVYTFGVAAPEFFPRYNQFYISIDKVEAIDEHTVQFKLKQPYADLLTHLSQVEGGSILPKHIYEGTNVLENPANAAPIGTGPFKFESWERGVAVTLVRNDDYYMEGKPYLDRLVFVVIGEVGAVAPAFRAGDLDFVYFIPPSQVMSLSTVPDAVVASRFSPSFPMWKIQFNLRHDILQDTRVRQALFYATNREEILEKVFTGLGIVPTSVIADTSYTHKWHNPNTQQYPYDPELAEQLLDEAGYPRGEDGKRFTIKITSPAGVIVHLNQVELIKDHWAKIGVEVEIVEKEIGIFLRDVWERWDFEAVNSWYFGGPTPTEALGYLQTSQINRAWFTNNMGWSNSRFDELFQKQQVETNEEKRKAYLDEMQELVMADPPEIYLVAQANVFVFKKKWHGLPAPVGNPTEWYGDIWVEE